MLLYNLGYFMYELGIIANCKSVKNQWISIRMHGSDQRSAN